MVVRVISERLVHAWVSSGFFVIRMCASGKSIAAAATCVEGKQDCVWLTSQSGFVRSLKLHDAIDSRPMVLEAEFLSEHFKDESFCNSSETISLNVGDVFSMSAHKQADCISHNGKSDPCSCTVEVFGSKGFVSFSAGNGAITESLDWDDVNSSTAMVYILYSGPLQRAIVPRRFVAPAVVTVSAGGLVRATYGNSFHSVCKQDRWKKGDCNVVDLLQCPVFHARDSGNQLFVIVGRLRGGLVLFVDNDGKLATSRFVLIGGTAPIPRYGMLASVEQDGLLVLEEIATGHRTSFLYERKEGKAVVDLDWDKRLLQPKETQEDGDSTTLRRLLQGIEELGNRGNDHEMACKRTDELLASYDSALLFLSACKGTDEAGVGKMLSEDAFKVHVGVTNEGDSARLQLPSPLLGSNAIVTVSFKNPIGVTFGDGWMLRLVLRKLKSSSISLTENTPLKQARQGGDSYSTSIQRVMMSGLQRIVSREERSAAFPVAIDSHAPISISVSLVFRHPVSRTKKDSPVDVSVVLCKELVLDVLYFAKQKQFENVKDSSHELIKSSQLMKMFSGALPNNKNAGYQGITKFDIPISVQQLTKILNLSGTSTFFESLVGAQFTISIEAVFRQEMEDDGLCQTSTVTVRGASHVIPFVRAAVIRHMLIAADKDSSILSEVGVRERANINRLRKSLHIANEECLPLLREAENRYVESLEVFTQMSHGDRIDYCFDGQESDMISTCLHSVRTCYGMWRRQSERFAMVFQRCCTVKNR